MEEQVQEVEVTELDRLLNLLRAMDACSDTRSWVRDCGSLRVAWEECAMPEHMLQIMTVVRPMQEVKDLLLKLMPEGFTFGNCEACARSFKQNLERDNDSLINCGYLGTELNSHQDYDEDDERFFSAKKIREHVPVLEIDWSLADKFILSLED